MITPLKPVDSQLFIASDPDAVASLTARLIVKAFSHILERKKTVLFIPSSGNTPLKTYQLLATKYKSAIDWTRVTLIQMDEYTKHDMDETLYFKAFLSEHLARPLGVGAFISMHKTDGRGLFHPEDYAKKLLALGPVDFALHGIGRNGHIGFNEPGSSPQSETRIVSLTSATQEDNFPNLDAAVRPKNGMTLGLNDFQKIRHTLLIATGEHKSFAIRNLVKKSCVSKTPACVLWKNRDFGIIMDKAAAGVKDSAKKNCGGNIAMKTDHPSVAS